MLYVVHKKSYWERGWLFKLHGVIYERTFMCNNIKRWNGCVLCSTKYPSCLIKTKYISSRVRVYNDVIWHAYCMKHLALVQQSFLIKIEMVTRVYLSIDGAQPYIHFFSDDEEHFHYSLMSLNLILFLCLHYLRAPWIGSWSKNILPHEFL